MVITLENLLQCDYESNEERGSVGTSVRPSQQLIKTVIPDKYREDIQALCRYAGVDMLLQGMTIKMTLQEILTVIPRGRARLDSYRMLVAFLKEEMNVDLILTSRKTK